mgnify:CR=1 FL=1
MKHENGWRRFFNQYAENYKNETYVQSTLKEVEFIENELRLPEKAAILDVGCGIGRHAIELAKKGYKVTGLDISENMLNEAANRAESEGVKLNLIHADATEFSLDRNFDACISLCEGAFGLLSIDEDPLVRDLKILENINKVLKSGGDFLLTALNGLRMVREYTERDIKQGKFDPITLTEIHPLSDLIETVPSDLIIKEKGFTGAELTLLLKLSGFKVRNIWGGTAGAWNKEKPKLDEMELMVIAKK